MKISIASGKGGTGKTTVAVNLALSIKPCQILDCDVEEPNVHIFLNPDIKKTKPVKVLVPLVDDEKCTRCGHCAEVCEFNALAVVPQEVIFFEQLCMSCAACWELCPENAITTREKEIGEVRVGQKNDLEIIDGSLNIGQARAIPVIQAVKDHINSNNISILDSPPGASCPVIETIEDTDFCILVTEPTPFGLWDLKIMVEVVKLLKIPFGIIINREGLGEDDSVEKFCEENDLPIILRIPFDRKIAEAYSRGVPIIELYPKWQEKFQSLYDYIKGEVNLND
ncbi:MAG: P-loop NTPase [Candidatus Heimdallarchaeota archaeon]|nr:P-loop NTPase [Candidatus Heimdallarchaeota archaeon]